MPFCPNCGTESEATQQFCRQCGASLAATVAGRQTVGPAPIPETGDRFLPYYLSPTRILLMAVLSYGLYLFYWLYLTWKQYRDHTGREAFPVWHALTQFVPIYNLFRFHAHVRTYKELMINTGVPSSLSPGWAVVILMISSVLVWIGLPVAFGEMSQGTVVVLTLLDLVSTALLAGLLLQVQENLNRYWGNLPQVSSGDISLTNARIGVGEIILLVIGLLAWFDTLMMLFSAGYRSGSFGA